MTKALIERNVEGDRGRGMPRRQWKDDLKQWTGKRSTRTQKNSGGQREVEEECATMGAPTASIGYGEEEEE